MKENVVHKVNKKFRFHIPGLIHLPVSEKYNHCAYTQKIVKLTKMMMSLGHEVYVYGAEGSDVSCTEFIQTHTLEDIKKTYGDGTDNELGYDYKGKAIDDHGNARKASKWLNGYFITNVATEINKRKKEDDFFLTPVANTAIAEIVGLQLTVESGIGYVNSFARFRAFESNAIMNHTYGAEVGKSMIRPNPLNRVIPNFFDPKDFEYKENKQEFFLFVGRIIYSKGVTIAAKVAEELKTKLLIAGPGARSWDPESGHLVVHDPLTGKDFDIKSKYIEYVGYVDAKTRSFLMSNAKAVLVPSLYTEPFGGVNVEAQLCGTPVLATPFGAFPETIVDGKTGFICHTANKFVENARKVGELNPKEIRTHAERYLMDNVKWEYQDWFEQIYDAVFKK